MDDTSVIAAAAAAVGFLCPGFKSGHANSIGFFSVDVGRGKVRKTTWDGRLVVAGGVDERAAVLAGEQRMVNDVFAATMTSGYQMAVGKMRRMDLGSRKKSSGAGPRG